MRDSCGVAIVELAARSTSAPSVNIYVLELFPPLRPLPFTFWHFTMSKTLSKRINGFLRTLRKEESTSMTPEVEPVQPNPDTEGTIWKRLARPFTLSDDDCPHVLPMGSISTELPVEIWMNIIWFALEPQYGTNQYFRLQDLQFFYLALIIHYFSNPAFMETKRTRGSLRLVSKAFKALVDEMKKKQEGFIPWLSSYSPDNAMSYAPTARLDTQVHLLENIGRIEKPYPHEISILSIQQMFSSSTAERQISLLPLLANPGTVGVLHLSCISTGKDAENFPLSILSELTGLHTLSIASHSPMLLNGKLEMPWLRALFLSTGLVTGSDLSGWKFKELQSLSIDSRGWPLSGDGYTLPSDYISFMERHATTIRSLRLIPMLVGREPKAGPVFDVLQKMERLESLATDFVRWSPVSSWKLNPRLGTVEHLVHISTQPHRLAAICNHILPMIQIMTGVNTLAITEDPFQDAEDDLWAESKAAVKKLDATCRLRGITIYGNMGVHVCCVKEAAKRLTNLRMDAVQEWYETSL
ncbi:hypothetical protein FRC16_003010 [Serendipita sp. 398]|nr:hypothetical protein FRC16_003010 [Serendipita sp. 398]